ncbi:hypothetical protein M422DRAFT_246015 [Sphaerobolus stellatus SS14]|nr:hypothetical protein M422DRAFT_246015 [Sphaerobolus stellatus SS14]
MALWLLQNVSTAPVTCSRDKGALIPGLTVQDTILSLRHGARGARRERNLITIEFCRGAELQIKNFLGWRLALSITYLTSSLATPDNMYSIPSRCIIQVLRDPESSRQLRPLRILRTLWLTLCLHRRGLKIFLWGGTSGECLAEFENAHKGGVYTGSWSPGSRNIVTSSANCTVKIWDVETRKATTT